MSKISIKKKVPPRWTLFKNSMNVCNIKNKCNLRHLMKFHNIYYLYKDKYHTNFTWNHLNRSSGITLVADNFGAFSCTIISLKLVDCNHYGFCYV